MTPPVSDTFSSSDWFIFQPVSTVTSKQVREQKVLLKNKEI
jgi:hypothetical protein